MRNGVLPFVFFFVENYLRGFPLLGLGLIINQIYPSPTEVTDPRHYQVNVSFNFRILKSHNLISQLL